MLIVTDKQTLGIGREGSLAGTRETEEESDVAILDADIGRRVKGKLTELDWLEIVLSGGSVWGRRPSVARLTITEKTPFFISPAYSVPRITISMRLKLISTEVVELMPLVKRLAGN